MVCACWGVPIVWQDLDQRIMDTCSCLLHSRLHGCSTEAKIIFSLAENSEFPDPKAVGVPITSYMLGLADVLGELRRQTLDALRTDDLKAAESLLETMEQIYLSLIAMEEASLLKGLRRKTDIARGIIERTRSDVTAEAGRKRLNESVRRLAEWLG
jgi:translin